jgi:hypothetical protein
MPDQSVAPKKFIIQIPMYRGKGRNKSFVCNWYVTGFSWRNMSDAEPNKIQYGADRSRAISMGKITAQDRLSQFRLIGEVVPE